MFNKFDIVGREMGKFLLQFLMAFSVRRIQKPKLTIDSDASPLEIISEPYNATKIRFQKSESDTFVICLKTEDVHYSIFPPSRAYYSFIVTERFSRFFYIKSSFIYARFGAGSKRKRTYLNTYTNVTFPCHKT